MGQLGCTLSLRNCQAASYTGWAILRPGEFQLLHTLVNSWVASLFNFRPSRGVKWYLSGVQLAFPQRLMMMDIFSWACWPSVYRLWWSVCLNPSPLLKIGLCVLLLVPRTLDVFWRCDLPIFDLSGLSFHFIKSFEVQMFLILIKYNLSVFSFNGKIAETLPKPRSWRSSWIYLSPRSHFLGLTVPPPQFFLLLLRYPTFVPLFTPLFSFLAVFYLLFF